jgi:oligopeptidase A
MSIEVLARPGLPAFRSFSPDQVQPVIAALLEHYALVLAHVKTHSAHAWETLFTPLQSADRRLSRAWSTISHLHNVCDSDALREPYANAQQAITEFNTALMQDRELYQCVARFAESEHAARLSPVRKTVLEHWLRDFRLGGVALEEPARTRFAELAQALSKLATGFEEALLDATDAWSLQLPDSTRLAGLPDSALAALRQAAKAEGLEGYRVTLRGPSLMAVMTYAEDRELRAALYQANATRASDQGPHAGQFDNGPRIEKLLAARHEAAQLIGFANAAEESLATKMAPDTQRVVDFLEDLVRRARPPAQTELAALQSFATEHLQLNDLQPWDIGYAAEQMKLVLFDFDDEQLKPYFPLPRVLAGLFQIIESLFAVKAQAREVEVWHTDVQFYDLVDANTGQVIAGFYLDLFARERKRGGAWMDVCRSRCKEAGVVELPIAYLNCNFAPPLPDQPALLTHEELITLFHEFGHGLHHMLTQIDEAGVSGIAGVEWDAVELPSQFMENYCWSDAGLKLLAAHWQTGAALPVELLAKLQRTRFFQTGLFLVRQLEFGLFDFLLHRDYQLQHRPDVMQLLESVRDRVAVIRPPAWQRFPMSFSHIFAGGYGAGYYSYLWAEVLSADAFAAFPQAMPIDRETGMRFRREVLEVGGSRPALQSFMAFRGREPDASALLESYGLTA